jgi:hypothetical protein
MELAAAPAEARLGQLELKQPAVDPDLLVGPQALILYPVVGH